MKTPRRSPAGGCFVGRKFYAGGQFLPATGQVVSCDEARIAHELGEVTWRDEVYARSMSAILRGSKAIRHRLVLRSRRIRAIGRLVDAAKSAGDYRARKRLHELHQLAIQGHLALAGC